MRISVAPASQNQQPCFHATYGAAAPPSNGLAQALIDAFVETLGLRSVVEFTQHTADEMYRAGRGWGTEWTPAEVTSERVRHQREQPGGSYGHHDQGQRRRSDGRC